MDKEQIFTDRQAFRKWLIDNHDQNNGFWMVFSKADTTQTLKTDEALEEALCFGWIDGQIKSIDETKYVKKFTPRRKNSRWSAYNRQITERLIKNGLMEQGESIHGK
jgi:uncharacterized protein YdeI (YjbR/CyaY-like superfamily)